MRGFLLAATAVTALLAGGAAANAADCIGGYKTLGNQVIIRCTDDDYGAGFYGSAPYDEPPVRSYAYPQAYDEPVYEDYGYNDDGYDEPIVTGSIYVGGGHYYEPRLYPRRHYEYESRWDDCRPGWGGGWPFGC